MLVALHANHCQYNIIVQKTVIEKYILFSYSNSTKAIDFIAARQRCHERERERERKRETLTQLILA